MTTMTTDLWSRRHVDPPPFLTFKVYNIEYEKLTAFKQCLSEATNVMKNQDQLTVEFSLLMNLRYIRWATLRRHKQMQTIRKVLRCLSNLKEMEMGKLYEDLDASCPRMKNNKIKASMLPSKQMLEHLLVRTLGMLDLLLQTCDYCFLATECTYDRLKASHFLGYNIIVAACLSRIWVLCATLAVKSVEWYEKLYPWLNALTSAQIQWLSSEQALPSSVQYKLESGSLFLVRQTVKSGHYITTKYGKDPLSSLKKLLVNILDVPSKNVTADTVLPKESASETDVSSVANYYRNHEEQFGEIVSRTAQESAETPKKFLIENFLNAIDTEEQLFTWLNQENVLRKCKAHQLSLRLKARHWGPFYQILHKMKHQNDLQEQKNVIIDWFHQPGKNLKMAEKKTIKKQKEKSHSKRVSDVPFVTEKTNLALAPSSKVPNESVEDSHFVNLNQCKEKSKKRHLEGLESRYKKKKLKLKSDSNEVLKQEAKNESPAVNKSAENLLQEIDDIFSVLDGN